MKKLSMEEKKAMEENESGWDEGNRNEMIGKKEKQKREGSREKGRKWNKREEELPKNGKETKKKRIGIWHKGDGRNWNKR